MLFILSFDSRLLSSRLPRSLLLATCLLNTFVAAPTPAIRCELKLEQRATDDGSLLLCLAFGELAGKSVCSARSPAVASWSWNQIQQPVSLGFVYFGTLERMDHTLNTLPRGPTTLGESTPWEYIDGIIALLSRSGLIVDDGIKKHWEETLYNALHTPLKVWEYKLKANSKKTGDVRLRVGDKVKEFSHEDKDTSPKLSSKEVFSGLVHFRDGAAMERAFSHAEKARSKSETDPPLPLPKWFTELVSKGEIKLDSNSKLPDWVFPLLRLHEFIKLLSNEDGGWTCYKPGVKAITADTWKDWEDFMKQQVTTLAEQKKLRKAANDRYRDSLRDFVEQAMKTSNSSP
ncbi:hypothetical protein C8R42DRAFT_716358 [Lentinula raphanica]|nr:hypothetical protein C8R42DRAFT_716358 [Lentinula raphanica]